VSPTPVPFRSATPQPPARVVEERTATEDFHAGATVLIYEASPNDFVALVEKTLDRLVADNVNSISLTFPIFQDKWYSNEVKRGSATLTDANIALFVERAHARGFTVLLRPIIDEQSFFDDPKDCGSAGKPVCRWRGNMEPRDARLWFDSYTKLMVAYARIAEQSKTDIFSVGVELNSMVDTKYAGDWKTLIAEVRGVYAGKLVYSMNHGASDVMGFEEQLDYIGIDAFYSLEAPTRPTVDQLVEQWAKYVPYFKSTAERFHRPVILTELGVRAEEGAHLHPWYWDNGTPLDLEEQRVYYEAACKGTKSAVGGYYFWHTTIYPPARPEADPTFEFAGKPAERAMAACYAS